MKLTASTGCVFILVCIAIAAGPGDGKSKEFVTPTAKAAKALFERQVGEAEQAKQVKVAAAKAEYLKALAKSKDDATRTGNLDEAVRIRDAMEDLKTKAVGGEAGARGRERLAARLVQTIWKLNTTKAVFNADGTMSREDGAAARWAAMGDRTVVVVYENGWVDVLEFDDGLTKVRASVGKLSEHWDGRRATE